MKKRTIIIISIIIAVLLLAGLLVWFLLPRFALSSLIENTLPEFESAQMFDSYDVADDSLMEVSCDNYTIGIPADLVQQDIGELSAQLYMSTDQSTSVLLVSNSEPLDMNLLDDEIYKDIEDMPSYIAVGSMEKAFESLGNGVVPDNSYNTYKSAALLDSGDYNFWSVESSVGYIVMGTIKSAIAYMGDTQYIYEHDNVRGIVYVKNPTEYYNGYSITADLYTTDDLDTPHAMIIKAKTLDEAYAILNSVKFN